MEKATKEGASLAGVKKRMADEKGLEKKIEKGASDIPTGSVDISAEVKKMKTSILNASFGPSEEFAFAKVWELRKGTLQDLKCPEPLQLDEGLLYLDPGPSPEIMMPLYEQMDKEYNFNMRKNIACLEIPFQVQIFVENRCELKIVVERYVEDKWSGKAEEKSYIPPEEVIRGSRYAAELLKSHFKPNQ